MGGEYPRGPGSVLLDGSYHKKQEYLWFRSWDLKMFFDISPFYEVNGWDMPLGDPRSVSMDGSCH